MAENAEVVPREGNESSQEQQPAQPHRPSGWQMLKSLAFQLFFIYLITSFFRRGNNTPPTGPDGQPLKPADNIFSMGQLMVREGCGNATPIQCI